MKRINISIEDDLLSRIDSYSKKRYLSRSGLISFVLSSYLDVFEMDPDVVEMDPDVFKSVTGFPEL